MDPGVRSSLPNSEVSPATDSKRPSLLGRFGTSNVRLSTQLTAAMVALVVLTATSVGVANFWSVESVAIPRALDRLGMRTWILASELEASLRVTHTDVNIRGPVIERLARSGIAGRADPGPGASEAEMLATVAARFVAELRIKPMYSQYRLIGVADGGRELVRVDRMGPGGSIRVVPQAELQRKGDRGYFREALLTPAGQTYASLIDFNQEGGVFEVPHVPTLRVAAPVVAPDGKPFGILIINVDLRPAFEIIRSARVQAGSVYVVNARGDYLVHPDRAREFGFEHGTPIRIQDDFPEIDLKTATTGARVLADRTGERFAVAASSVRLAGQSDVTVIAAVPYSQIIAVAAPIRNASLLAGLAGVLIAVVVALFVARSLTRPLLQITRAVEGFSRGGPIIVPRHASSEIGVLARAFVDMTAELRAKTGALNREIEEHRRVFETSLDLILVIDRGEKLLHVSPSCMEILGYRPEEMIGRSVREFLYPDDLESTRNELRLARRGHRTRTFDTRYLHKDGRIVSLSWTGVWSEPVQRHFFIGRDMTAHKKAADELRESGEMARGIVDTALDAFVQMDAGGKVTEWNPQACTLFGWTREEAMGRTLADLIVPARDRALHAAGLARFLRGGESSMLGRRLALDAQRRDGHEFKVELSVTALRRRDGYVFNGFIRDLTERIAAEEQLRQAQKMEAVGQLTGGVAHDFNNILTVITGTIEILAEAVADKPELRQIAGMIDDAAQRGADLTQRLLAFARRQPLQPRRTEVHALLTDLAKLLRPTLGEHVEVTTNFQDDLWPALVDPGQLTTALLNIAVNARDAMPGGGKLMLEASNAHLDETYGIANGAVASGPYVMIAMSDTGCGIPAAIQERVFEPFFTTKDVGKGTGLGLSMVYGFVKQSGGHIKVYSEEGLGTTIRIYLPKATGAAMPSLESTATLHERGDETILVVEDDSSVRKYVVGRLGSLGYKVLAAENAAEALAIIDAGAEFDLLFTDVVIPGAMNGRQLAEEATKRRPGIKVLYTSGYSENALVHHGRLDSGVLLLSKPYRMSDLARMIRTACGDTSPSMEPIHSGSVAAS